MYWGQTNTVQRHSEISEISENVKYFTHGVLLYNVKYD